MIIRYNTDTDFTMNSAWIFRVFVCNQCQSSPSTPIFACVGFTLVILLFSQLTKLIFYGFARVERNFLRVAEDNSYFYDMTPFKT